MAGIQLRQAGVEEGRWEWDLCRRHGERRRERWLWKLDTPWRQQPTGSAALHGVLLSCGLTVIWLSPFGCRVPKSGQTATAIQILPPPKKLHRGPPFDHEGRFIEPSPKKIYRGPPFDEERRFIGCDYGTTKSPPLFTFACFFIFFAYF